MDDIAKAQYDDKLISDQDYYVFKLGKFGLSVKYLFLGSLGIFCFVYAISENSGNEKSCPTSYKMKKVGIDEEKQKEYQDKIEEKNQDETANTTWIRYNKKVISDEMVTRKVGTKIKYFTKKPQTSIETEDLILNPDKSIIKSLEKP
jgi:hypothetical protein